MAAVFDAMLSCSVVSSNAYPPARIVSILLFTVPAEQSIVVMFVCDWSALSANFRLACFYPEVHLQTSLACLQVKVVSNLDIP